MKNLPATEFSKLLRELRACSEASEWAKGKDLAEVWHTCHRGDWMLWLLGRESGRPGWPTRKEVCAIVCDVVEPSMRHVRAGELRPQACIDTVRRWIAGTATIEEVREARTATLAARRADAADDAAYAAADAAAYAAAAADAAAYAAAAYAAYAAAADAAYAARNTYQETRARSLRESADVCRRHVSIDVAETAVTA